LTKAIKRLDLYMFQVFHTKWNTFFGKLVYWPVNFIGKLLKNTWHLCKSVLLYSCR
jgi:hypothetical protein